ncbi:MAG: hypothetical protein P8J32_02540 [bacterium]|nr:hypothetical protein [bacterium]
MTQDTKHFAEIDIYQILTDLWTDVLQATHGRHVSEEDPPRLMILDGSNQSDPNEDDGWMNLGARGGILQVWLCDDQCLARATDRSLLANTHEGQEEVLAWVITQWHRAFTWARDEYAIDHEALESHERIDPGDPNVIIDGHQRIRVVHSVGEGFLQPVYFDHENESVDDF